MQSTKVAEAALNQLLASYAVAPLNLGDSSSATIEFDGVPITFSLRTGTLELLWLHIDLGEVAGDKLGAVQYLASLGFETWANNIFTVSYSAERARVFAFTALDAAVFGWKSRRMEST